MAKKNDYKEVSLEEKEKKQIGYNVDEIGLNIETAEFNIKQLNKAIKLGLPLREAHARIDQMEDELKKMKFQQKRYQRMARTGKKEVPNI